MEALRPLTMLVARSIFRSLNSIAGSQREAFHLSASLFDQGLVSGSNFLLGIAVARFAGPEQYGIYFLVFSLFLLAAQLHQAVVLDPMAVLQPAYYPDQPNNYVSALMRVHWFVVAVLLAVLAPGLWVAEWLGLEWRAALPGLLWVVPSVLLFWFLRAGAYLRLRPQRAALGSCLYATALLGAILALLWSGRLTPLVALSAMSLASIAAAVFLAWRRRPEALDPPSVRELWKRHWELGRWLLGVQTIGWVQTVSLPYVTTSFLGTREVGVLTAIAAFALPVHHLFMAASRPLAPRLASLLAKEGTSGFRTEVSRLATKTTLFGLLYLGVVTAFHRPLVQVLYGERYIEYSHLLPWYAITLALTGATFPYDIATKVLRTPRLQFYARVTTTALTVIVGILAIPAWGLAGAIVTNVLMGAGCFVLYRLAYGRALAERTVEGFGAGAEVRYSMGTRGASQ